MARRIGPLLGVVVLLGACASNSGNTQGEPSFGDTGPVTSGASGTSTQTPTPGPSGSSGNANANANNILLTETGTGDGTGSGDARCGFQTFELERTPAEVFLVLDRSGSMDEHKLVGPEGDEVTRWVAATQALIPAIEATGSGIFWGLKTYPEEKECQVTSVIDVEVAEGGAKVVTAAIAKTTPEGDGTPTAPAIDAAAAYLAKSTSTRQKYLLLATDGEPNCDGSNADDTVAAVEKAAARGIPTFVVGISTKSSSVLNRLAIAGGKPRLEAGAKGDAALDPRSDTPLYYSVDSGQGLVEALHAITGQVVSCRFPLKVPPPAPDFVDVVVAGKSVDRGGPNGWDYVGSSNLTIEVFGDACETVKRTNSASSVDIVFGCPGVQPPPLR